MKYIDLSLKKKEFLTKDEDAIIQKINLLLKSKENDWFFSRDFGCNLEKYLFTDYNPWEIDELKFDLKICFNKFVPEVEIMEETDLFYDESTRKYILKIVFKIIGLNNIYEYNLNL